MGAEGALRVALSCALVVSLSPVPALAVAEQEDAGSGADAGLVVVETDLDQGQDQEEPDQGADEGLGQSQDQDAAQVQSQMSDASLSQDQGDGQGQGQSLGEGDYFTAQAELAADDGTVSQIVMTFQVIALPDGDEPGRVAVAAPLDAQSGAGEGEDGAGASTGVEEVAAAGLSAGGNEADASLDDGSDADALSVAEKAVAADAEGSLTIPARVETAEGSQFDVTEIGACAFGDSTLSAACAHLTSVSIPDTVTTVGWRAFRGCTALTTLYFAKSVPTVWADEVFDHTALTAVAYAGEAVPGGSVAAIDEATAYFRVEFLDGAGAVGDAGGIDAADAEDVAGAAGAQTTTGDDAASLGVAYLRAGLHVSAVTMGQLAANDVLSGEVPALPERAHLWRASDAQGQAASAVTAPLVLRAIADQDVSVPEAPQMSALDTSTTGVTISWSEPADGGAAIEGYNVYLDGVRLNEELVTDLSYFDELGAVDAHAVTGTEQYQVAAVNAAGEGALSGAVTGVRANENVRIDIPYVAASGEEECSSISCIFHVDQLADAVAGTRGQVSVGFSLADGTTEADNPEETTWFTSAIDRSARGSVTIPETVQIGNETFDVAKVNKYAFGGNDPTLACGLSGVTFGALWHATGSRAVVDRCAFMHCINLRTVTFAENCALDVLGYVFAGCTGLRTLHFECPASNMDFESAPPLGDTTGWIVAPTFTGCRVQSVLFDASPSYVCDGTNHDWQVPWNVNRTDAATEYVRVRLYGSVADLGAGTLLATSYVERGAELASFLPRAGQTGTSETAAPKVYAGADALPALPEGARGWAYMATSDTLDAPMTTYASFADEALAAPVLAGAKDGASNHLSWENVDGVVSWKLYRTTEGTAENLVAALPMGTTTYVDATPSFTSACTYRIVGVGVDGSTVEGNTVTLAPSSKVAPTAPTDLSALKVLSSTSGYATASGTSAVLVGFAAPQGNFGSAVSGYRLYRAPAGTTDFTCVGQALSGTASTVRDATLAADDWGRSFTYYVTAVNAAGESPASATVTIAYTPQVGDRIQDEPLALVADDGSSANVPVTYEVTSLPAAGANGCATLTSVDVRVDSTATGALAVPSDVGGAAAYRFDVTSIAASDWNEKVPGLTKFSYPQSGRLEESGALFAGCANLTEIVYPAGMKVLSANAANACAALTTVTLGDGLETVCTGAFEACGAITSLEFPASVRTIEGYINYKKSATYATDQGRNAVKTIIFDGDASAITCSTSAFESMRNLTAVVFRGDGFDAAYFPSSMSPAINYYYTVHYYGGYADAEAGANPIGQVAYKAQTDLASIAAGTATSSCRYAGDVAVAGMWDLEGGNTGSLASSPYAVPRGSSRDEAPEARALPAAPASVGASSGAGTITLSWTANAAATAAQVTTYVVYRNGEEIARVAASEAAGSDSSTGAATFAYTDAAVRVGSTYTYNVAAVNAVGEGEWSAGCFATAIIYGPPTAPQGLRAKGEATGIVLNWQTPDGDGGTPVTGYNVYLDGRLVNEQPLAVASVANALGSYTYTVSGLEIGVDHTVAVSAVNLGGEGSPCAAVSVRTQAQINDVVSAPVALTGADGATAEVPCRFRVTKLPADATVGEVSVWGGGLSGSLLKAVDASSVGDLVIPDSITLDGATYRVTEVGAYAFGDDGTAGVAFACAGLTSISLPGGMRGVCRSAFSKCASLKVLEFRGDAPQSMGDGSAYYQRMLASGTALESVVYEGEPVSSGCVWLDGLRELRDVTEYVTVGFKGSDGVTLGEAAIKLDTPLEDVYAGNADLKVLRGAVPELADGMAWEFDVDYELSRSAEAHAVKVESAVPSQPRELTATASSGSITLSWKRPAGSYTSSLTYNIYRDGVLVNETPLEGLTYEDAGLEDGVTHAYTVSAVNSVGEGAQCDAVSAMSQPQAGDLLVGEATLLPADGSETREISMRCRVLTAPTVDAPGTVEAWGVNSTTSNLGAFDAADVQGGTVILPSSVACSGLSYTLVGLAGNCLKNTQLSALYVPSTVTSASEYLNGSVTTLVLEGDAPDPIKYFSNGNVRYTAYLTGLTSIVWGGSVDLRQAMVASRDYVMVRYYPDAASARAGEGETARVAVEYGSTLSSLVEGTLESDELLAGFGSAAVPEAPEGTTWRYLWDGDALTQGVSAYAWDGSEDPEPEPTPDPEPTPTPDPEPDPDPEPAPDPTPTPAPSPDATEPDAQRTEGASTADGDTQEGSQAAMSASSGSAATAGAVASGGATSTTGSMSSQASASSTATTPSSSGTYSVEESKARALASTAGASSGGGSGDGSGSAQGLAVTDSYPSATSAYAIGDTLWVMFSKNIATYAEKNADKVTLETVDGDPVAATVWMADPGSDFDHRQYIYITPDAPLDQGQTYVLRVASGVLAKNGMTYDATWQVTFTPGGMGVVETNQGEVDATGDSPGFALTADLVRWIFGGAVVLVLVAALVVSLVRLRRNHRAMEAHLEGTGDGDA